MTIRGMPMWNGDYGFVLSNLVKKDFKVRYRNMSLGVLWSVLNPLVTMGALAFVFTQIFPNRAQPHMAVFLLCGLVPFNFFAMAWNTGTGSLAENYSIMKRVTVPRELFPIATVLGNCVHLLIQIGILFAFTLGSGLHINRYWLWLPYVWFMEILFVCGLAMATSAINVYIRDTRYVVESVNTIMFYFVPIFYSHKDIPKRFTEVVHYNPVAALILALRNILWEGVEPAGHVIGRLTFCSLATLAAGFLIFRRLKSGFFDHM
jgi:ABC-type polysaccharide/polyol phosphate export permease